MQTISAIMKFLWLVHKNYRVGSIAGNVVEKPVTIRTRGDDHKKQKESNAKTSIIHYNFYCCCKGNLLRGIDIWSGAAYKELKSCFDNSFVASDFCAIVKS